MFVFFRLFMIGCRVNNDTHRPMMCLCYNGIDVLLLREHVVYYLPGGAVIDVAAAPSWVGMQVLFAEGGVRRALLQVTSGVIAVSSVLNVPRCLTFCFNPSAGRRAHHSARRVGHNPVESPRKPLSPLRRHHRPGPQGGDPTAQTRPGRASPPRPMDRMQHRRIEGALERYLTSTTDVVSARPIRSAGVKEDMCTLSRGPCWGRSRSLQRKQQTSGTREASST